MHSLPLASFGVLTIYTEAISLGMHIQFIRTYKHRDTVEQVNKQIIHLTVMNPTDTNIIAARQQTLYLLLTR